MKEITQALFDAFVDRTPGELIGALMFALVLSLILTGAYALGRRKIKDPLMVIASLMLVASVTSMTMAAGYVVNERREANLRAIELVKADLNGPPRSGTPDTPGRPNAD